MSLLHLNYFFIFLNTNIFLTLGAPVSPSSGFFSDCFAFAPDSTTGALTLKRTLCSKPSYYICQMGKIIFSRIVSGTNPTKLFFLSYHIIFPVLVISKEIQLFSYVTKNSSLTARNGKMSKIKFVRIVFWTQSLSLFVLIAK